MSNDALGFAFKSGLDPGPRFVLVVLGDHGSDHDGEDWSCFPSVERIMSRTGYGRATVERHLKTLFLAGWISRTRRRLRDGRLGIYDFVIHRDPETRARLRAARAAGEDGEDAAGDTVDGTALSAAEPAPPLKMSDGPALKNDGATAQIDGQPYVNLRGQEPSVEPSVEPSQDGRAGASAARIARIWGAYPDAGRKGVSSPRLVEQAFAAEVRQGCDPDRLEAAVAVYGRDRSAWGSSGRPIALHRLISEGRYEAFLPSPGSAAMAEVMAAGPVQFGGPSDVRAAFVAAFGEASAVSWLDRCGWDPEPRALRPATRAAADWLERNAAAWLQAQGLRVERAEDQRMRA